MALSLPVCRDLEQVCLPSVLGTVVDRRFGDAEEIRRPAGVASQYGWPSGSADLEASWLSVQGKVKFFDPDRGFGFISREGGDDVFVHVSNLQGDGAATLAEGQLVEFEIGPGRKGDEARNVHAV